MQSISVLVVDDGTSLTEGLLLALPKSGPVSLRGPVPDDSEATVALERVPADVVVVDIDRQDGRGLEVVAAVSDREGTRVLAYTGSPGTGLAAEALAAGACGLLPVERQAAVLIDAFTRAAAGELVLPAVDLSSVVDRLRGEDADSASRGPRSLETLTTRERQILAMLAEGVSTSGVALALSISPMTVQTHVKNILVKLGVHSKVEAVRLTWRRSSGSSVRTA